MTEKTMPQLPLPGEEAIKMEKTYVVLDVEEFKSEVQGFIGWRVTLDGGADSLIAIPLWVRDIVGRSSKMGSFIEALGNVPDKWIGVKIQFVRWVDRDRAIKVVK